MKVLFTFFNPSGGMETLNRIRSKALFQHNVECHLLYTQDGEGIQNIKNIRTYITNNDETLQRIIDRECYDVICVCSDISLLEKIGLMEYEGHLIFEVQGLGTLQMAEYLIKDFSGRIMKYADAVLYPQTAHLKALMHTHIQNVPQYCFDNPLDTEEFGYTSYPKKNYPIIGWVGRIEANKNWREYLEIGSRMLQLNPNIYLWMFEDATLYEVSERVDFEKTVLSLNLSSRLIRHSNIPHEQMADYFSIIGDSGGFVCSTSIIEGFGYAVAESMLCRCPVLTTDSDGIRQLLLHDCTGKMYPRGNIDLAIQEAFALINHSHLRESIREQAQNHIRKQFSTTLYSQRFIYMLNLITSIPAKR